MKVLRIENDRKRGAGHFTIWVWARHDPLHWRECSFAFKHEKGLILHIVGGENPRFAGKATTQGEAIDNAIVYLENWLRECGAID